MVDGQAAGQRAGDEGDRTPDAQRAVDEAARPGLVHQHAVIERHGRRPDTAPHQADQQQRQEGVGDLVGADHHDGGDGERHQHAAQPADSMGEEADAQHRHHAHQLAAHEQRADLGIADAAVAQPHRPVAHEGAGGEEVGGAISREAHAFERATHIPPHSDAGLSGEN